MGTFSPAVDHLTATGIRRDVLGCAVGDAAELALAAYGYRSEEIAAMGLVHVDADAPDHTVSHGTGGRSLAGINPSIDDCRVVCCHNRRMVL